MSAFRNYETQFRDQQCLVDALKELGYAPEVHEKPVHLFGYHGDKREQTAEVVIRRNQVGSASNDVGYKRNDDGSFSAIISDYDNGCTFNKTKQKSLARIYAEKQTMTLANANGMRFISKERVKGASGQFQTKLVFESAK